MHVLLVNYMRRWWWAFVLAALVVLVPSFELKAGQSLPVGVFGPALLSWEATRGASKVRCMLPVARRTLGRTLWIQGVGLFPVLAAVIQTLATGILVLSGHAQAIAFVNVFTVLLFNTAFASFMMLLLPRMTEQPVGLKANLKAGIVGAIWGLSIPGAFIWSMNFDLMRNKLSADPILWPAAGLLLLVSYLDAPRLAQARQGGQGRLTSNRTLSVKERARLPFGFRGVWMRETQILWMMAALGFASAFVFTHVSRYTTGLAFGFVVATGMFILSRGLVWAGAVRSLRTLPVSRSRLALFLMSVPWVGLVAGALLAIPAFLLLDAREALNLLPGAVGVLMALQLVISVLSLRFGPQVAIVSVVAILPPFSIFGGARGLHLLAQGSVPGQIAVAFFLLVIAVATFFALRELLAQSSAVYRDHTRAIQESLGRR